MREIELIKAVKTGDRNAFNNLYRLHWSSLVSYSSVIVGDTASKDVVHDVFLKVWINRRNLNVQDSLRPYLMRAVYNKSLNVLRSRSHFDHSDDSLINQLDFMTSQYYNPDNSDIVRKLYSMDAGSQIAKAIEGLPPKCREIFKRSYIESQRHQDIADDLGISLSTVDNQIYKALKYLRTVLSNELFFFLLWFMIR